MIIYEYEIRVCHKRNTATEELSLISDMTDDGWHFLGGARVDKEIRHYFRRPVKYKDDSPVTDVVISNGTLQTLVVKEDKNTAWIVFKDQNTLAKFMPPGVILLDYKSIPKMIHALWKIYNSIKNKNKSKNA